MASCTDPLKREDTELLNNLPGQECPSVATKEQHAQYNQGTELRVEPTNPC